MAHWFFKDGQTQGCILNGSPCIIVLHIWWHHRCRLCSVYIWNEHTCSFYTPWHNCYWNRIVLLRWGLRSTVTWNSLKIILVRMGMREICAKWVPKLLNDEHKCNRVAEGLDLKSHYHAKREDLFHQIVTGDEKWVHHFTQDEECIKAVGSESNDCLVKAKQERLAGKVYLRAFWDN